MRQSRLDDRLQVREESFEETRDAGKDVDVSVDDGDRNPHVFRDEEGLVRGWDGWVVGEFDHAELGGQAGGRVLPVEVGLHGVRSREFLHAGEGWFVELELEVEGFRD